MPDPVYGKLTERLTDLEDAIIGAATLDAAAARDKLIGLSIQIQYRRLRAEEELLEKTSASDAGQLGRDQLTEYAAAQDASPSSLP